MQSRLVTPFHLLATMNTPQFFHDRGSNRPSNVKDGKPIASAATALLRSVMHGIVPLRYGRNAVGVRFRRIV